MHTILFTEDWFSSQAVLANLRRMNSRLPSSALLFLASLNAQCGGVVVLADRGDGGEPADAPAATRPRDAASPSPGCAEVRASCGAPPQQFVRGHAEGLTGLDGARVQFAMRYLLTRGNGLNVPHGVVSAWGRVQGGAFEACVCLPRGANEYPELAAVVFAPGSTGETGRDVARAVFSRRYATLGDENVAWGLREAPSEAQAEAALAAMVDRTSAVGVGGLSGMEGARAYGGLVADERPVAAQVVGGAIADGRVRFQWIMPGRQWPGERLALLVDRNGNRRCDDGDLGASIGLDGRQDVTVGAWLQGASLNAVCRALLLDAERER